MTLFLVLAMVLAIALVQGFRLGRARRAAAVRRALAPVARASPSCPPAELLLHPGHTWVRVHDGGLASVGVTDFASNFAGRLSAVELPREGERLRQAELACALVSDRERRLGLPMPIEGKVLAVNRAVLEDPSLTQRRPYDDGWLLRVQPKRLHRSVRNLLPASTAQTWIDLMRARLTARLTPALGALAHDGGEWSAGFGERLDDASWEAIRRELFPEPGCAQEALPLQSARA